MSDQFSYESFHRDLANQLPTSDAEKRVAWAQFIIANSIDLIELSQLLHEDRTIAMRYAWLLTDVALLSPTTLFNVMPFLLKESDKINHFKFVESFANYWLISGVPEKDEVKAINLLFQWISSDDVNVTIKSRAIKVLVILASRYPDLKNELSICLKEQMNRHSEDFKKKAVKILGELEED